MDLLKSLHELEELVANSSHFLLTNKCLINEDELVRLIDNIRSEWPSALSEAEEITRNRDKILADAHAEAKNIIEQAKAYAQKKVSEHEVIKSANSQAKYIHNSSMQYSGQIFDYTNKQLETLLATVEDAKNRIQLAKDSLKNVKPIEENPDKSAEQKESPQEPQS